MNRGVDESRMRGVDFPISLSALLTLSLFRRESPRIRRLILVRHVHLESSIHALEKPFSGSDTWE
jgi:hypothetical protein